MHRLIRTLAFATLLPLAAAAQQFPNKVVRLMVPFPPGGATDIVGRLVAAKMQEVWGQPVVVENRPGAGTVVGTDYVAKSAPDGYTLGMVVTAYVINPSLRGDLPYNTLKDLTGVTQVSVQPLIKSGKIKVLALLSPQRARESPEYPVVAEAVPGVSALSIVGIVAPGATPRGLIDRISADIARAMKSSDLTERMKQQGMEPVGSTPAQFDALIRSEIAKWAKVVRLSGAKVD